MAEVMSMERSKNDMSRHDADVNDCSAVDSDRKSSQTSWLYQCMISECFATFERLADLRIHHIDVHQSGIRVANYIQRQPQ